MVHAQYTPEKLIRNAENEGWNRDKQIKDSLISSYDFTQNKEYNVYLPSGADWFNFYTNELFKGGSKVSQITSFDKIPLYIKAGSILPLGPDVQYAAEKPWDNLQINVYPGADASFVLYEDESDNYNYEKGAYTEIPISWNDKTKCLTIGVRKGKYQGMLEKRKFTVSVMGTDKATKVVDYSGKKITVKY